MERIIRKISPLTPKLPKKKRVAAYARVSSDKEAMLHSLSAQVSYYSGYIQQHSEWEYVGVFADEALTGTKDSRPEFQRMLYDCHAGRIDMVITKSISRFARNTVTMLETLRELQQLEVDVYFERENLHSMSGDGELMVTILASFAQAESLSVSENCKWRVRNGFKDGKANNMNLFGYRYAKREMTIVPEEAAIVQEIFTDYLNGMGKNAIMKKLNAEGKVTRNGKAWREETISRILHNEKYSGDLLLQKTYISDHLSKRKCFNRGELPKYFVSGNHIAIIDRNTFEKVQKELARRSWRHKPVSGMPNSYAFTGRIVCAKCGRHYRRRIANAGSKYAQPVWICSTFKQHGKASCNSKQIPEDILTALTTEVLDLPDFNPIMFREQIKEILVPEPNQLVYKFHDGHELQASWQNKSRKSSWTESAKQQAREKALAYQKGVKF